MFFPFGAANRLVHLDSLDLVREYQRPKRTQTFNDPSFNVKPQATAARPVANRPPAEYLEATLADVELAHRLAGQVLGQSLDALVPQTRCLLMPPVNAAC